MGTPSTLASEQRIVLRNVSWKTFEALLHDLGCNRGRRLAYDRGMLEIMSPSLEHEAVNCLIRRLVEAFTEELDLRILSAGSTTLNRPDLLRGVEPDACYYLSAEAAVRGKIDIDLSVDPPPDLAIEVQLTGSLVDKLGIYAALGVAEVWIHDGKELAFHLPSGDGRHGRVDESVVLPGLRRADIEAHLAKRASADETTIVRSFREWSRRSFSKRREE